jgi:hypothetical protein
VPYVASFSGFINLENTERTIKNEQSIETGNIGHTRHRKNKLREY